MAKQKKRSRKKTKKKVKYDPNKHIVPMSYHRYLDALDECEAIAYDFIEQQIGRERFEELQQELEDNGTSELKDVAWEIMEQVSSLFKTPQEQFDNCPYSLGDEDFQPSKNFYSPKDFSKPLGVIDDE